MISKKYIDTQTTFCYSGSCLPSSTLPDRIARGTFRRSNVSTSFTPNSHEIISFTSYASLTSSKSLPVNPFADPHPLNPVTSILYKNIRGRGPRFSNVQTFKRSNVATRFRSVPFVRHSCENCRVCTQNSHSRTHLPPVLHFPSPLFSTTSAMPILQPLYFDGLPSNGGCTPLPPVPLPRTPNPGLLPPDTNSFRMNTYEKHGGEEGGYG